MKVWAIVVITFRQAIRNRILYSLLFFSGVVILSSVVIGRLSLGEDVKIIKDFGLGAISLLGVLMAIFIGTDSIYREITHRTIYTLLSKPIGRGQFLLGQYLGLLWTVLINVVAMAFFLEAVLFLRVGSPDWTLFRAIGLMVFELMLLASIAILFSVFLSRVLSTFATLAIYVGGHMTQDLVELGEQTGNVWIERATTVLYYLLPDLEAFNIRSQVVQGLSISSHDFWIVVAYGLLYLAGVFLIALKIFQHRDFV